MIEGIDKIIKEVKEAVHLAVLDKYPENPSLNHQIFVYMKDGKPNI